MISYKDFLDRYYPTKGGSDAEQNAAIQVDRLLSFARPGGLGAKFKNTYEKMQRALNLPKGAKEELNFGPGVAEKAQKGEPLWDAADEGASAEDDDAERDEGAGDGATEKLTEDEKRLLALFGEGKYHLIPSFFRTLIFLKKQRREFAVCFRTFGKDLPLVTWEFNQFCVGNHPCFSGRNGTPLIKFDGSKATKDLRFGRDPDQKACYYRFSHELKDAMLCAGTTDRPSNNLDELRDALDASEDLDDARLIQGAIPQYQHFLETLKKCSTMAVQEDFYHWKENNYHPETGKLLLIDQAEYNT